MLGVTALNYDGLFYRLAKELSASILLRNEPMSKHTSFRIGGPADILIMPGTIDDIKTIFQICDEEKVETLVMGNGSNLLVRDKGIRGVVIKIADNMSDVKIDNERVVAQAGVLLSKLSKLVVEKSLKGFEFASGIPGTLGGAVTMNAGAYGGEMKDVIIEAKVMDGNREIHTLTNRELDFGYRSSIIQRKGFLVLDVTMELEKGNPAEIKEIIRDFTNRRTTKQPLHLPSAGSTFKRPQGYFAGKLIEDAGLKGVRVGGAQVSELHSGFIVNVDHATAEDVLNLIGLIQKTVRDKYNAELQPEVRIVGEA
jgi:UDP-N-acetylmuramate dehydrogenase